MFDERAQSDSNMIFAIAILIFGAALVIAWSLAEALNFSQVSTLAKWGLALLIIVIEFIHWLLGKVK